MTAFARSSLLAAATLAGVCFAASPALASTCAASGQEATPERRLSDSALSSIVADARSSLAAGDVTDACVKFRLVLSIDPQNVDARIGLGEGAMTESDGVTAQGHFQAVVDAHEDNALAQQGLGLVLLSQNHPGDAEPHLRRAVELDATLWRAWNGLGVIADTRSDWTASDAAWQAAIAADPSQALIYNNQGMSLLQRGEAANAVHAFDQALRLRPNMETAANNRRLAVAMTGDYDGALAGLSDAALPAAMNNIAVVAARRGDRAIADRLLATALTESPRYYELAQRNREALAQIAR